MNLNKYEPVKLDLKNINNTSLFSFLGFNKSSIPIIYNEIALIGDPNPRIF